MIVESSRQRWTGSEGNNDEELTQIPLSRGTLLQRCGRLDSRMGALFECECIWRMDGHIDASIDLLQTAVSKRLEVAGGLRFSPGAFQHDVMMTLYDPVTGARLEPNGTSCIGEVT